MTVLAEDKRSQQLARRFLLRLGYSNHHIHLDALPAGAGSGAAFVVMRYPVIVKSLRSCPTTALLTHIDADQFTVDQRRRLLDQSLDDNAVKAAQPELLFHWIPKWNIEAWLLYLLGRPSHEDADLKHEYEHSIRPTDGPTIRQAAERLYEISRPDQSLDAISLPLLRAACGEARRISGPA